MEQFVDMLQGKRSLLMVWLLTERLHMESTTNGVWKRFLLNQELFEKNISEMTLSKRVKHAANMDIQDLTKMLARPKVIQDGQETQLSIFDFFREIILAMNVSEMEDNQLELIRQKES